MMQLRTIDPAAFSLVGMNSYLNLATVALKDKRNADARDYLKAALSVARKVNPNACKHIRRAIVWNEKAYAINLEGWQADDWAAAVPTTSHTGGPHDMGQDSD